MFLRSDLKSREYGVIAFLIVTCIYGISLIYDLGKFERQTKFVGLALALICVGAYKVHSINRISDFLALSKRQLATQKAFYVGIIWQITLVVILSRSESGSAYLARFLGFRHLEPDFADSTYGLEIMRSCLRLSDPNDCNTGYPSPATWLLEVNDVFAGNLDILTVFLFVMWFSALISMRYLLKEKNAIILLTLFTYSPALTFALDRGNIDLLIGALNVFLFIAIKSKIGLKYPVSTFFVISVIVSLETQLKIYPIFLFLAFTLVGSRMQRIISLVSIVLNGYLGLKYYEWIQISDHIANPSWTGFGLMNMYQQIVSLTELPGLLVLLVLLTLFYLVLKSSQFTDSENFVPAYFRIYLIFVAIVWIVGESYPYRMVILAPLILLYRENKENPDQIYWVILGLVFLYQSDLSTNLLMFFIIKRIFHSLPNKTKQSLD